MSYNYWEQDSELYKQIAASLAEQSEATTDDVHLGRSSAPENQPESHLPDFLSVCGWSDDHGSCNNTVNVTRIGEHMLSCHFKSPLRADSRLECRWKGCQLRKPIRRDTMVRHIVEKHLGVKYRSKHQAASCATMYRSPSIS
ncbi:uncharacterized protein EDB91DRAFT_1084643 [Suillus paluster]|uniref:uncharacterized protein n=1 Tax=Suillus paluster TaxID=48578 RepID=UPI001B86DF82|nr:uncharacterized protein EDB91DRAFT_1084643 [Suillus paluster]KAG1732913.1 hypothetical protein EDB91DRAFT_1084643 [Suillus paluster]